MSDTGTRVPDQLLLLPLRQRILEQRLGVRAVHLHRAGHEDLTHRFVEDTAENIYSVSKTVTALAVGIAAEEGLLDPEDLLSDHLPAPAGGYGTGIEQVQLRHLLTMTSGSPVLGFLDEQREHRSEEHTSELQSRFDLVCRLLLEKIKKIDPLFANTHFNQPIELTAEARGACERRVDAGMPVGNQTVVFRGINSSVL